MFYRNKINTIAGTERRNVAIKFRDFVKHHYGMNQTNFNLVNVRGAKCHRLRHPSKFNEMQCGVGLEIIRQLLDRGFAPGQILHTSPYTAQRDITRRGLDSIAKHYPNMALSKLTALTFDGARGAEADMNIMDLTVSDDVGFLKESFRLLVGASRGKNGLIIIANKEAIAQHANFTNMAIGQLLEYCVMQGAVYHWPGTSKALATHLGIMPTGSGVMTAMLNTQDPSALEPFSAITARSSVKNPANAPRSVASGKDARCATRKDAFTTRARHREHQNLTRER